MTQLAAPRQVQSEALCIAGVSHTYTFATAGGIPPQWMEFAPRIPELNAIGTDTFGVIHNPSETGMAYLSGVQMDPDSVPEELVALTLPAASYLVFNHPDNVASLSQTCEVIWMQWLPASEYEATGAPWFERYGSQFDPINGDGGLEVWIPVSPR